MDLQCKHCLAHTRLLLLQLTRPEFWSIEPCNQNWWTQGEQKILTLSLRLAPNKDTKGILTLGITAFYQAKCDCHTTCLPHLSPTELFPSLPLQAGQDGVITLFNWTRLDRWNVLGHSSSHLVWVHPKTLFALHIDTYLFIPVVYMHSPATSWKKARTTTWTQHEQISMLKTILVQ